MSKQQKKQGMEFFKKFSVLSGMKIKGPKDVKPVAQTQTNFNFSENKHEEMKTSNYSRDDSAIVKRQSTEEVTVQKQSKQPEITFKKSSSKLSETSEKKPASPKIVEDVSVEKLNNTQQSSSNSLPVEEKRRPQDEPSFSKSTKSEKQKKLNQSENIQSSFKPKKTESIQVEKKLQKPKSQQTSSKARKASTMKESKQIEKPKKSDKEQVFDQINQYVIKLIKTVLHQRDIKLQITQNKESIIQQRKKISVWTSQQAHCAERQQYDEADRLQTLIQESHSKIDEWEIQTTFLEEQIVKQENEEINLLKLQNSSLKRISRKLKLVQLQIQDDAANYKRQQLQKIQNLKNKQDNQKKKIMRIQKDINYQSEQISQFQKIFHHEMDGKLNPLLSQKETFQHDKTELQLEIKQLEKRLKDKKAKLTEVVKSLKGVNDSISEINESFQEQTDKLQQRKTKLEQVENERDEMQLTLSDIDNTIQMQTKNMDAKVADKIKEANQLAELAKDIEQNQQTFDDQLETRKVALDNFLLNAKIFKQFEETHRAQKQKLKQLEYKRNTAAAEINKLQDKKEQLKKELPILEAQQKKFAEQKNFKAAGIKKGEIKEINDELNRIKESIDACLGEECGLEAQYQELCCAQKESNDQQAQLQRNLAISQVKFNQEKLRQIQLYRSSIVKAIGVEAKQKYNLSHEMDKEIQRILEESKYLSLHYELKTILKQSPQKQESGDIEEQIVERQDEQAELVDQGDVRQQRQGIKDKEDSVEEAEKEEETAYTPPFEQKQQEEVIQEEEDTGYVPLSLD